MPYRRLPNTDTARTNALEVIANIKQTELNDTVLSYEILHKADTQLAVFNNALDLYRQALSMWQEENLKYRDIIKNLTTYISHFVQVYNFAIIRGEIKPESRAYYNMIDDTLPDLSSEENILDWGKRLIEGERKRIFEGGTPMTNPTIASINIYYEKFNDLNFNQNVKKNYIEHTKIKLHKEREAADKLIKEIWNCVEAAFIELPEPERLEKCKQYGIIYYERSHEKAARYEQERIINEQQNIISNKTDSSSSSITTNEQVEASQQQPKSGFACQNAIIMKIPFD